MRSKNKSARSAWVTAIGVMGLVLACVAAAAILMAARQPSSEVAQMPAVEPAPSQIAAEPTAKKTPVARTPGKVTVAASYALAGSATPAARAAEDAAAPKAPAVESATRTVAPEAATVTITGCLERDAETFRLKDTTGTDAPKSRNWKSGFLKKGRASIEVVDAAHRLNLANHVGQRVSVTGLLVDREMTLRSLQPIAASCD